MKNLSGCIRADYALGWSGWDRNMLDYQPLYEIENEIVNLFCSKFASRKLSEENFST